MPRGSRQDLRPPSLPNSTECRHRRRTASRRRGAAAPPSGDTSANSENRRSDLAARLATSCASSVSVIFVPLSSACKCAKSGLIRPRIARGRRSRTPRIYVIASIHESGFVRFSPICLTMLRRCASCSSRQRLPPASFRPPVTRRTFAVRLTLTRFGYVEDYHLQESAPGPAHKKRPRTLSSPRPHLY